ncbi:unnamed protein product [Linum trigynum]|uniref:Uncharacterized protein n=1 Tax=Linum trigynum TaxID=586398 RepID=A0AAV2CXX0_9ROSI
MSYNSYQSFPLDLDALLEKAHLRLFAKPRLNHRDHSWWMRWKSIEVALYGVGKREEGKKERSRGWSLMLTQVHEPSSTDSSNARDLRHQLTNANRNFKEVLGWTET